MVLFIKEDILLDEAGVRAVIHDLGLIAEGLFYRTVHPYINRERIHPLESEKHHTGCHLNAYTFDLHEGISDLIIGHGFRFFDKIRMPEHPFRCSENIRHTIAETATAKPRFREGTIGVTVFVA